LFLIPYPLSPDYSPIQSDNVTDLWLNFLLQDAQDGQVLSVGRDRDREAQEDSSESFSMPDDFEMRERGGSEETMEADEEVESYRSGRPPLSGRVTGTGMQGIPPRGYTPLESELLDSDSSVVILSASSSIMSSRASTPVHK
jgi:hypothetical protein